jgi:hypothetical protein
MRTALGEIGDGCACLGDADCVLECFSREGREGGDGLRTTMVAAGPALEGEAPGAARVARPQGAADRRVRWCSLARSRRFGEVP